MQRENSYHERDHHPDDDIITLSHLELEIIRSFYHRAECLAFQSLSNGKCTLDGIDDERDEDRYHVPCTSEYISPFKFQTPTSLRINDILGFKSQGWNESCCQRKRESERKRNLHGKQARSKLVRMDRHEKNGERGNEQDDAQAHGNGKIQRIQPRVEHDDKHDNECQALYGREPFLDDLA